MQKLKLKRMKTKRIQKISKIAKIMVIDWSSSVAVDDSDASVGVENDHTDKIIMDGIDTSITCHYSYNSGADGDGDVSTDHSPTKLISNPKFTIN